MKKRLILLSLCLFVWHSQAESQQNVAEFLESELCQIEMEANDNPQTESEINKLAFLEKKGCKFLPIKKQKGLFPLKNGQFLPLKQWGKLRFLMFYPQTLLLYFQLLGWKHLSC